MKDFAFFLFLATGATVLAAAPTVDFEKPYSTVTEAMKLVAANQAPGGRYLFDAALCADATGDRAREQELLQCFVAKEPKPTAEVRRALVRLCRAGASSDFFRRYLKDYPHDADALSLGLAQGRQFAVQSNVRELETMISLLLETWPRGDERADVLYFLQWLVDESGIPEFWDCAHVLRMLEKDAKGEDGPPFVLFVRIAQSRRTKIPEAIKARYEKGLPAYDAIERAFRAAPTNAAAFFAKCAYASVPRRRWLNDLCDRLIGQLEKHPETSAAFPTEPVVRMLFGHVNGLGWSDRTRQNLLRVLAAQKREKEVVDLVCRAADGYGTAYGSRAISRSALVGVVTVNWKTFLTSCWADDRQKTVSPVPADLTSTIRYELDLLKILEKAPVPEFVRLPNTSGVSAQTLRSARAIIDKLGDAAPADARTIVALANEYRRRALPLIAAGADLSGEPRYTQIAASELAYGDADQADPIGPAKAVFAVVRSREQEIRAQDLAGRLMKEGRVELAYLVATRTAESCDKRVIGRIRAEASAKMPGLYPVGPNDPAYPVYVAADAFGVGNYERAWSLLSDRLAAFDRDPLRFRPDFALWVLEQYRRVKGRDEVLLNKAAEHLEAMLAKETILPIDVVGGLYLLRAEIARDRLQTDAAHAAYLAVRNDARFRALPVAREAMFQDVQLLLETGNIDAASQTAESWLTDPEDAVRAEAHYILAKVAFARKDYEETRKELDRVFEIDFTHAEARLLQGAWKLATNYELDDAQVLLGDLADRQAIRPGQPLTVTVQDRNLSVAGGGESIPVVVRTSAGGDEEKMLLATGTRDPSLFRGSIDTRPGVAEKGNGRLELAGDDTVTYAIDPAYLKARGLPVPEPKRLKIVDDADLTVNEGETRRTIRPGSALRLCLKDADRTRHSSTQSVDVALETTSGDRLTAHLKETAPCSGVFTATVPTALPPPRSFASDTRAGGTAADLASSARNRPWQSRADGVRPKSAGVDMMDSALVKSARLVTKEAANIPQLRLYGTLYGEERVLGSYPADSAVSRQGIRAFRLVKALRGRTDFLRELARRPVSAKPCGDWEVRGKRERNSREILRALVYVPETVRLRFRLESLVPPPRKDERDFRFGWGRAEMRCDGVTLFMTQGTESFRFAREGVIEKGVHELELYAETHTPQDQFAVRTENEDGSLAPLPQDWLDAERHPELKARLVDLCAITREADGFTATFAKPERLRKLRWEMCDFAGSAVSAEKLEVVDANGRKLIPCAKDYAGALGDGVLDLAPGDVVKIVYDDQVTLSDRAREVEARVDAKFSNGRVAFTHEEIEETPTGRRLTHLYPAYRVAPGDTILVRVEDDDLNLTEGADTAEVTLRTDSGNTLLVKASERLSRGPAGREYVNFMDEGVFFAQVPTVEATETPPPEGVLALKKGESVRAIYVDVENTDPGVKAERTARLQSVPDVKPVLKLASTTVRRVVDNSPEGKGRLASVRRRASSANATNAWKCVAEAKFPSREEEALVTPEASVPVELWSPGLVRHGASRAEILIATKREIQAAKAEKRDPAWAKRTLTLRPRAGDLKITGRRIDQRMTDALPDALYGFIELKGARAEERAAAALMDGDEEPPEPVDLLAGDELVAVVPDATGRAPLASAKARIATAPWIALSDETLAAEVSAIPIGESFHVVVADADRDVSDEQDEIRVEVASKGGEKRTLTLRETLPRSGVFSAALRPVIATGGASVTNAAEIASSYSDEFTFAYDGRTTVGRVLPGSTGSVRSYSKRFRDADQAVLVQFRLAECLFEMAKDYRKAKLAEKSSTAIADGRRILDQALKDYPHSVHAAEGEYLLANLHEQLAEEAGRTNATAIALYNEAIARYASILSAWPNGEHAARCQYHKALCLERLGDYARASEEYVKITYLYPESPLVGDASVRLAAHYYKEKRYDTAAKIYSSFRTRFPSHAQAPNALFMSGQCQIRRAEEITKKAAEVKKDPPVHLIRDAYLAAVECFAALVESYRETASKDLLAQALYFAGDASFNARDYPNAYLYLKRTTFEYPETKWARHARGLLLQESKAFEEVSGE